MKHVTSLLGLVGIVLLSMLTACGADSDPLAKDISVGGKAGAGGKSGAGGKNNAGGASGSEGGASTTSTSANNPCTAGDGDFSDKNASELFGATKIPTFDFHLPAEAWTNLKANARAEQYVEADACFEGKSVGKVGLRFKGAYGSLYDCFNDAGENTCRKLGMKVKFNEYVPGQVFYGLKRLNFQGYRWDTSYMKEHLAYELYREMGIQAPRSSWAKLRVNGEEQGLFGMVEQIDGKFAKDRWPDNGDANLYKEVWPGQTDETWIKSNLETNEDTADISGLLTFAAALNSAPEGNLRATLGNYLDLDYLARYMAVDDAIANFDGVTTFYTGTNPEEAGNHNFYLYQESPNKFTLIPWDLEATLSLMSKFGNVPEWQRTPKDCSHTYPVWSGANQVVAPGCNRVFQGLAADLTAYRAAARQLLDGPFTLARITEAVDRNAAILREAAVADPHGAGEVEFEKGVGFIKQELPNLRRRLEHLVSGEPTVPLEIDLSQVFGFETTDSYGAFVGSGLMCNSASTSGVDVNKTTPISGTQSLRILFNFGNEAKAWEQWMQAGVSFAAAPKDLTSYKGIRFKARSNKERVLRVDLDSRYNSAVALGVQVGWEKVIGTTTTEVAFNLLDAKVPTWATDPKDDLNLILKTSAGLVFKPQCAGRTSAGQLPAGTTDDGWVDIDDIELF